MSNLTATALSPILQSLPPEEIEALIANAEAMLPHKHKPKKKPKKDVYANMPDHFRPENHEALVQMIMSNNFKGC